MIRLYLSQVRAAMRTAFADRASFALQLGGMAVNNAFMMALWVLFFAGFRQVGGWTLADTALLVGSMMLVFGLAGTLFGGYRDLAGALLRGDLDALLTQPKPVLPQLLSRECSASAWGDVLSSFVVLALADLGWRDLPLLALGLAA
ncbi:MAG: ABC-2 family transporter protein, partial [Phenylobacterium sp.]